MWPRFVNVAIGIWLLGAPAVLGYGGIAADVDRTAGPAVAAVAAVAVTQATRSIRWLNLPIGLWLLAAPLILDYPSVAAINSAVSGLLIAGLSLVPGKISLRTGGGWAALFGRHESGDAGTG